DASDGEARLLGAEYLRGVAGIYADRILRFGDGLEEVLGRLGGEWEDALTLSDHVLALTADQSRELIRGITELLTSLPRASGETRAESSRRVVVQLQVLPTTDPFEPET